MLKFMNTVLILMFICGGLQLSCGEKLKCGFHNYAFSWSDMYTCHATSLDNSKNDMVIKSYTGTHSANLKDKDVKAIWIYKTITPYIPKGLGSIFNLIAFLVEYSELIEIKSDNFLGMQNVENLSFIGNKLTSVPSDTFSMLPKLKVVYLKLNQIKYFGTGVFDQLKNLNTVYFQGNICVNNYYVGATAITQMKEDIKVNCIWPILTSTTTTTTTTTTQNPMEVELGAIKNKVKDQQLKNEIELNKLRDDLKKEKSENLKVKNERDALMNDRESLKMELNNKTSEINELKINCKHSNLIAVDVKLNVMNTMMEQILKASKEHQMECNELIKLRAELVTAKDELKMANDQQKKEQLEYLKVTKERDQMDKKFTEEFTDLKKKLSDAKETIEEKLPKMEQTIEDFYIEVFELKIERHYKREDSIALRSKLMEAKEQLAECQINERIFC